MSEDAWRGAFAGETENWKREKARADKLSDLARELDETLKGLVAAAADYRVAAEVRPDEADEVEGWALDKAIIGARAARARYEREVRNG